MKNQTVAANYIEKFHCIGSLCEETCCSGWNINIDIKTFEKYQKVEDEEIKKLIKEYVIENENKTNNYNYAKIKMDSNNRCPFLDKNALCMIHKKLGSEALSNICNTYPRNINFVRERFEITASTACPEAARLILLASEPIKFIPFNIEKNLSGMVSINKMIEDEKFADKWQKYSKELNDFSLEIVQKREYELIDRILFIGLLFQKMEKSIEEKGNTIIPEIIDEYKEYLKSGEVNGISKKIPRNLEVQYTVLSDICELKAKHDNEYSLFFDKISEKYKEVDKSALNEKGNIHQKNYFNFCRKYFKEKEYIFENYITNYILHNSFPFGDCESIFDTYCQMVVLLALLRFNIIGLAGYYEKIDDKIFIEGAVQYSKNIEHSLTFLESIYKIMNQNGYMSLQYMVVLLKN